MSRADCRRRRGASSASRSPERALPATAGAGGAAQSRTPVLLVESSGAVVAIRGGARERLTAGSEPALSPDGARVAFVPGDGVHVRPLSAGPARPPTTSAALWIRGSRAGTDGRELRADQLVEAVDGSVGTLRGVGTIRFVDDPPHHHWHLMRFQD